MVAAATDTCLPSHGRCRDRHLPTVAWSLTRPTPAYYCRVANATDTCLSGLVRCRDGHLFRTIVMANTFTSLHYHIVFSTKNRERWITSEVEQRIWEYLGGIARQNDMKALQVG